MSIITPDIFLDEISIAQLSQVEVRESVQGFIDKYEPKLLKKLFGVKMYNDLLDGVGDEWDDLSNEIKPMIANYVYWFYMSDLNTYTAQVGVSKPKSENAVSASPVHKMVRAWNEFVDQVCEIHGYVMENVEHFPDYIGIHKSPCARHGCGCTSRNMFNYRNSLGI